MKEYLPDLLLPNVLLICDPLDQAPQLGELGLPIHVEHAKHQVLVPQGGETESTYWLIRDGL